jgi:hypothetical protein
MKKSVAIALVSKRLGETDVPYLIDESLIFGGERARHTARENNRRIKLHCEDTRLEVVDAVGKEQLPDVRMNPLWKYPSLRSRTSGNFSRRHAVFFTQPE